MENSRMCEICNVDVQKASMKKHLGIKKSHRKQKTKSFDYTRRRGYLKKRKHLLRQKRQKKYAVLNR